jgi:hypothetical protein
MAKQVAGGIKFKSGPGFEPASERRKEFGVVLPYLTIVDDGAFEKFPKTTKKYGFQFLLV